MLILLSFFFLCIMIDLFYSLNVQGISKCLMTSAEIKLSSKIICMHGGDITFQLKVLMLCFIVLY